ncbi:hypothetical protein DSCA_46200 [Desulfosarcina alkanivorans]|uniref:Uncharacterized protein n=1 Tax=Desulfosarcina alkanivorans TaxID=571177 RepID=A0A5K7YQP8_9BACT|nr:hypothetical protein DSCA_46200 [Desulfosarcina alkanivorans]
MVLSDMRPEMETASIAGFKNKNSNISFYFGKLKMNNAPPGKRFKILNFAGICLFFKRFQNNMLQIKKQRVYNFELSPGGRALNPTAKRTA